MVTAPHSPVPFSPALEDLYIPSPAKIEAAVRRSWRSDPIFGQPALPCRDGQAAPERDRGARKVDADIREETDDRCDPADRHAQVGPGDAGGHARRLAVEDGPAIERARRSLDIETSKIANVFESPVAGPLRRRLVGEGETVPVGALLAVVADARSPDADIDAFVAEFQESFAAYAAEAGGGRARAGTDRGRRTPPSLPGARRRGDGPPIVFLHGFGGDLNNWLFNQPALAESHATYAVDLPGHGGSTKELGAGHVVGALAAAVIDFLDAKGIGARASGRPFPGRCHRPRPGAEPSRAGGLGRPLIAPAGLGPEISMAYIDGFMQAKPTRAIEAGARDAGLRPGADLPRDMIEDVLKFKRLDGVEAALNTIAGATFAGGRQALELKPRLGEIKVPVQVIWGRQDRIVPAAHAEGLPAIDQGDACSTTPATWCTWRRRPRSTGWSRRRSAADRAIPAAPTGAAPCRKSFLGANPCDAVFPLQHQVSEPERARTWRGAMTSSVRSIPEGYHSLTPYLIVNDAAGAIAFYKQAFGATEVMRLPRAGRAGRPCRGADRRFPDHAGGRVPGHGSPESEGLRGHAGEPSSLRRGRRRRGEARARGRREGGPADQGPVLRRPPGQRDRPLRPRLARSTHKEDVPADELKRRAEKAMHGGS